MDDPGHDDFELWSPSEERSERCLFGRQVSFLGVYVLTNGVDGCALRHSTTGE